MGTKHKDVVNFDIHSARAWLAALGASGAARIRVVSRRLSFDVWRAKAELSDTTVTIENAGSDNDRR